MLFLMLVVAINFIHIISIVYSNLRQYPRSWHPAWHLMQKFHAILNYAY